MKTSKVVGQQSLSPQYYQLIGEFVVEWGWLEFRFQEAIWHMLRVRSRKDGRTITSQVETRGLARAFRNLAKRRITDPGLLHELLLASRKLEKMADTRNALAHGIWFYDAKADKAVSLAYRSDPILGGGHQYNEMELSALISHVREIRSDLQLLMGRV